MTRPLRTIRTYHEVGEESGAEVVEQIAARHRRLEERLSAVREVWAVASGKGGVGKSVIAANLAAALAASGRRVGAVDADLNGPSLARMLGVRRERLAVHEDGIEPPRGAAGVRVISMDLLLAGEDAPVRWQGPAQAQHSTWIWQSALETSAVREFLADVRWGDLDYLVLDLPPGTDKVVRVLELVPRLTGVLLVTTPSEMARTVVARSLRLLVEAKIPRLALVANMTSYACPACGHASPLYDADGARRLARESGVALWAEVPFDPAVATATDAGAPAVLAARVSPGAAALRALARRLESEGRLAARGEAGLAAAPGVAAGAAAALAAQRTPAEEGRR